MSDNILTLSSKDARTFFKKTDIYFSGELPKYFHFTKMLNNISLLYSKHKEAIAKLINKSKYYDDINFSIYTNKDGNYAWRKFQLINPILYIDLIYYITEQENWTFIIERFKKLHNFSKGKIICTSIPVVERHLHKRNTGKQILEWWEKTEQGAIALAQEFPIIVTTDITDCYPSIYTHSISWALHGKFFAKQNKQNTSLLGNNIDKKIQNMQNGQTNGIPQGSTIMDLLAELIFAYADCLLYLRLKHNKQLKRSYKILRYRDDYKIFVHSKFDGELIIRELSKALLTLNLKLNSSKTAFYDEIITGAIKADKIYALEKEDTYKDKDIYKALLKIAIFLQKFQNSRQMAKHLLNLNEEIKIKILQRKHSLIEQKYTINAIIGICTALALKNPAISINCLQIISTILEHLPKEDTQNIIRNIKDRFSNVPHSEFVTLFIQRITLPYNYKEDFNGPMYNSVYKTQANESSSDIKIWNLEWLRDAPREFSQNIMKEKFIHKKIIDNMKKAISKDEIDIFPRRYQNNT